MSDKKGVDHDKIAVREKHRQALQVLEADRAKVNEQIDARNAQRLKALSDGRQLCKQRDRIDADIDSLKKSARA